MNAKLNAFAFHDYREMCSTNSASLEISFSHLAEMQSLIAIWLTDVPREVLRIFDEVLQAVVLNIFPNYLKVSRYLHHSSSLTLLVIGLVE